MTRDLSPPEILFLDLESSGLYIENESIDSPAQPWAVSIAAALCNRSGAMVQHFHHLVKADGRTVKENAQKVHGISARVTSQVGVPEARVLGILSDMLKTAPLDRPMKVVTFSDFDNRVLSSLFARFAVTQGKPSSAYDRLWLRRPMVEFIDLQKPYCQLVCKLPPAFDGGDHKWPTLDESAEIILGRPPREGHHDAFQDMLILRDLYFHFERLGVFEEKEVACEAKT